MPRLGDIMNATELDNLYIDKVVVYVEGGDDLAFYENLVGHDLADRLEFKVPDEAGGHFEVRRAVTRERGSNAKIHGLLDGEAAVALGGFDRFVAAEGVFFELAGEDNAGLLFLSEHELENVVLCHADVAGFLADHVPFGAIGTRSVEQLQDELLRLARRFYLLSLLRFAAGSFHGRGTPCKAVDADSGMFVAKQLGVATILRHLRPKIENAGISWAAFVEEVRSFASGVSAHLDGLAITNGDRGLQMLRMADGKAMLRGVRDRYNGTTAWEGVLHGRLRMSPYAARFRGALDEVVRRAA